MALKVVYYNGEYTQKIEIYGMDEIDKVKNIALCLGYSVIDGGLQDSIDLVDSTGEYQGYYDPFAGIGAVWIDDNSEAHAKFNALGGEEWIKNSLLLDEETVTLDQD